MINQSQIESVLFPDIVEASGRVEFDSNNNKNNNNNNINNDDDENNINDENYFSDGGEEGKARAALLKDRFLSFVRVVRSQPYTTIFKKWRRKSICCLHADKSRDEDESGDADDLESGLKWVVPMLLLGTLDLLAGLVNFIRASERKEVKLKLYAGSVRVVGMENDMLSDLWLPSCVFTIVACLTYLPETANTITSLFRTDGTTFISLHLELLFTLLFEHIPLATISYFTKKWRDSVSSSVADGNENKNFSIDLFTTFSRLLFVSMRIVWYAHMEGKKIRKNDKYELNQIFFMLCCLLFAVTLAMPIMTCRIQESKNDKPRLQLPAIDCYLRTNLSITAAWEALDEMGDESMSSLQLNGSLPHLSDVLEEDDEDDSYRWRIYRLSPSSAFSTSSTPFYASLTSMSSIVPSSGTNATSSSSSSLSAFKSMKKLRISVCEMYKFKATTTAAAILAEYKCNNHNNNNHNNNNDFFSSVQKQHEPQPASSSSTLSPCLPGMKRLIFKFEYLATGTTGALVTSAIKLTNHMKRLPADTSNSDHDQMEDEDGKQRGGSWFSSLKRKTERVVQVNQKQQDDDVIEYEVGAFCDSSPYECLLYNERKPKSKKITRKKKTERTKKNKLDEQIEEDGWHVDRRDKDDVGESAEESGEKMKKKEENDLLSMLASKFNNILKGKSDDHKMSNEDDEEVEEGDAYNGERFLEGGGSLFQYVYDDGDKKVGNLQPQMKRDVDGEKEEEEEGDVCSDYKQLESWLKNEEHNEAEGGRKIFQGCAAKSSDE